MNVLNLTGEESNRLVLERVLEALITNEPCQDIIEELEEFLEQKKPLVSEIQELRNRAIRGDDEAARKLMRKLSEMNDGP